MTIENINNMAVHVVSTDEFDENPGLFCMSFGFNNEHLEESIRRIGLVNRPMICRNPENCPEIITGYRRIMALKNIGVKSVECIDISQAGLSNLEMLLLNLYENYATRCFNVVEKAMIINRLCSYLSMDKTVEDFAEIIGITGKREAETLIKIEKFDAKIRLLIVNGVLALKLIESISNPELLAFLSDWVNNLKLNYNQQLQLFEYINDISVIEGKAIPDILAETQYLELQKDDNMNTPQKAKKFISMLRKRRMPVLTEMEERFRHKVGRLNLPSGVRIEHYPFFEAEGYRLEAGFKNGKELLNTLERLAGMDDLKEIRDPWEK